MNNIIWLNNCKFYRKKINEMKSRLLRTILTLLVPVVIDYVVKKITEKKNQPRLDRQLTDKK